MARRKISTKQYLHRDPCEVIQIASRDRIHARQVGGYKFSAQYITKIFTSDEMHARAVRVMERATVVWAATDGAQAGPRWDRDPTYFAPSGRGNQLREYRLPQQGRKSVRGKTKPTTDDLLSLI